MGFDVRSTVTDAARGLTSRADDALSRMRAGARLAGSAIRDATSPGALAGAAAEAAWVGSHLVTYPLGVATGQLRPIRREDKYRTDDLPPRERGLLATEMTATSTPVLLVHGIGDHRSIFTGLATALRRSGFAVVHVVDFHLLTTLTGNVAKAAAHLGRQIDRIRAETGQDRVHLVAHSLGGLIARYYVQRQGGHDRVDTMITLGTPHQGTLAAYLMPTPASWQFRPGSDLLTELAQPVPTCRTRFVAIWSDLDEAVVPRHHARLDHPDLPTQNHRLRNVGHLSLPADPQTHHLVITALTQPTQPPTTADTPAEEPTPTSSAG